VGFFDYLAVIGIPSAIIGTIQLFEWIRQRFRSKDDEVGDNLKLPLRSTRTQERVVLQLNKSNIDKEGTVEFQVASYYRRLPRFYANLTVV